MGHLFDNERVRMLCSCGLLRPITASYFCRHCLKQRCANCVSHEMDMLYCPNCLENMPSPEARLKKNRCGNCFDCPSCGQSLSTRASSIQSTDPEQPTKSIQRKLYYLACAGCRWTSRDVNIPDQTVATGGWPEQSSPHQKRIQALLEHYRAVAQRDKLDREKRRIAASKLKNTAGYFKDSDRLSSMSPSIANVRKSLMAVSTYAVKGETPLNSELEPSVPSDDVDGLPPEVFTEPVNLSQICSMSQRLSSPEHQPTLTSDLYPLHKHMVVKRSLRCRHCEHNLSKPEYNPSSIKFKIQLGSFYHVPEIRMVSPVVLRPNQETCVELSLSNPTPHLMTVALLPYVPPEGTTQPDDSCAKKDAGTTATLPRLIEVPYEHSLPCSLTQMVRLPQGQLLLAARDDTAEYDDSDSQAYRDDPQVVAWRRANKVGVKVYVTPEVEEKEVYVGFVLRYDYTNTVIAAAGISSAVGPLSLGLGGSGPTSLGAVGAPSGPSSLTGPSASMGPTTEARTITLNLPVVVRVGAVTHDSSESHA